jgi:alpha-galactosidase
MIRAARKCCRYALLLSLCCGIQAQSLKPLWPSGSAAAFREALDDGIGFAFTCDGQRVGPALPPGWSGSTEGATATFRHPSGLVVARESRAWPEFDAIEYTVRFRNEGRAPSPALSAVDAFELNFSLGTVPGVSVVSSGGGLDESVYPPANFAIRRQYLGPMTPLDARVSLRTAGGRSSNKDLPFFFVESQLKRAGIFLAVGWSGQWSAAVSADHGRGTLRLKGGIPGLNVRLNPGEEMTGPRILLGAYAGKLEDGANRLRRLIRTHYAPRLGGREFLPVATYDHWWNIDVRFDEKLLRQLADGAASIGQEYFLLDAGWYAGTGGPENFSAGVGNWEEIDRAKFPSGLGAFADHVRAKGLKFGLWFEPERVAKGSLLAREHPDWVIWLPNQKYGLLDYGRAEVQEWVRALFDRYIREFGIRYIRHDSNIDPLPYWDSADDAGRRGMHQIRHIEGLYRVLDWIREKHPDTVLEGCSSGGRRIDLEAARRFHTFWISDQSVDPHIMRFHLAGLNYFLPGSYQYVCYTLPLAGQRNFRPLSIGFQSLFGGAFGTGGRVDEWPDVMKTQAAQHVKVHKQLRRFLMGDYYPLAVQSRDLEAWEAWQFHDAATGEGFVQAYRLHSPKSSRNFAVKALEPRKTYRLTDPYTGRTLTIVGARLLAGGIRFELSPLESQVWIYSPLTAPAAVR